MSGVADPEREGTAYQTASSDANEHLPFEFLENLLGEGSIGINGGYEGSQAKSLQDCATGEPRSEPATATSKSASKNLPTHNDDIMQDHNLESQQCAMPAGAANENAADVNTTNRPLTVGGGAVQPAQSDGMRLFQFSISVDDVDAPTSDNGKCFDTNITAGERGAEPDAALPDVATSTGADLAVHPSSAEPFHSEHAALHSPDMPLQSEGDHGGLAAADADNSHPLVVNDLGWHDWRLNDSAPLADALVHDPLSKFPAWGEASSTDTGSEGGKDEGEVEGRPEVEGQQQDDGRDKGEGDAGDGEGGARQGKNNTKPIVQVRYCPFLVYSFLSLCTILDCWHDMAAMRLQQRAEDVVSKRTA